MSLVGTRPPTQEEVRLYEARHRMRLATKPGITGMWQVNGRSNVLDFEEVVRLDASYMSILSVKAITLNATSICKGFEVICKNFLISFATLAGQISFFMEDGLPYWLSISEYLIGVILFAMFVNALYARYKE